MPSFSLSLLLLSASSDFLLTPIDISAAMLFLFSFRFLPSFADFILIIFFLRLFAFRSLCLAPVFADYYCCHVIRHYYYSF